jgi:hypothetical protein
MNAGILIFQYLFDPESKQNKLAVFLLKDRKGNLMDPGGKESHNPKYKGSALTASRELYEESSKLISIQAEQIETLPAFSWSNYKMFAICIEHDGPLHTEYFEQNREQLKQNKAKRVYFESKGFTYVFVQQLLTDGLRYQRNLMKTKDYLGQPVTIKNRTRGALKRILIKGKIDLSSLIYQPAPLQLIKTNKGYATYQLECK